MARAIDYHFLMPAPDLPGSYVMQAARSYSLHYHPIITEDWELVSRVPQSASAVATLLVRPSDVDKVHAILMEQRQDVHYDLVVAPDLVSMEMQLNERVTNSQPFGEES